MIARRYILGLACALLPASLASAQPPAALSPGKLTDFFLNPDAPSVLAWKSEAKLAAGSLQYRVTDYTGQVVTSGQAKAGRSADTVELPLQLKPGYYQVSFPALNQEFGVMSIAPSIGPADPFFCMDSALSWLEKGQPIREQLIQVMHRSGIAISRERVGWGHINPAPGKWDFNAVDNYQTLRETYARNQMPILEMFHHSPRWNRSGPPSLPYPADLPATAECWTKIAGQWRQYWDSLEIWNEPEGGASANWPAEQYIPTIKTLAYAFAQAGYDFPIAGGAFMGEDPGQYHTTCALNGMLDQVDLVTYHTYHGAADMERHVGRYREWLKTYGKESMPLWITESGEAWPAGTDRATQSDDARSAMQIAMKAVEARACGIARYFPFDLPFYVEGPRNFGMMGREGTPMRSMAAYAQCIAALSGKTYLGDLKADASAKRVRVFGHGDERTAVIFTGKLDKDASIRLELSISRIEGIDGRSLTPNADGSIPVPDGIVYLHGTAAAFAPLLITDTGAARLYAIAQQPAPKRAQPSPLVFQFLPATTPAMRGPDGYLIQKSAAASLPIHVRVWNLSSQALTPTLSLQLPGKDGTRLPAQPAEVLPKASAELTWTVDAAASLDIEQFRFLSITDTSSIRPAATPLAIPLRMEGALEEHLERHANRTRLAIDDLGAWTKNIANFGQSTFSSPAAGQWQMEVKFSQKTDEWVYPQFRLPKPVQGPVRGVLVRARAEGDAFVRLMVFRNKVATYWTSQPIIPADGSWHAAWVPIESFDPLTDVNDVGGLDLTSADAISVGMHNQTTNNENVLHVSDLYVVHN